MFVRGELWCSKFIFGSSGEFGSCFVSYVAVRQVNVSQSWRRELRIGESSHGMVSQPRFVQLGQGEFRFVPFR